ncbi:MAG: ornithine carbamoyltransferase [Ardenticatenaceae bacterium]|nr:ornithine carbamoyltransferase [Ardenticatenaceae bacterium]
MKHYLSLSELSATEIKNLLDLAISLKAAFKSGGNTPILQGKSLALVFQKPSLRTRVSFEMGMVHLGGYALMISPSEVKMGVRETAADVARVLSGYVDGIMARVFNHDHVVELAEYASVPVINGLSDYNHPAQALADLLTMVEYKGDLSGLKVAYVGDGNNVVRSLLFGGMQTGIDLRIATPAGYALSEDDYDAADQLKNGPAAFKAFTDPHEAVRDADVVYTDVWTSMGDEAETEKRLKVFPPYQVNRQLVAGAKENAIVMHCLPAHRGEEITAEIADGPQSVVFHQAENRLHAQKAILATLLAD